MAVGVSALAVVAATGVAPSIAIEPAEATLAVAESVASDDDERAPRWPRSVTPGVVRTEAARMPEADDADDDELLIIEDEAPAPARRPKPAAASSALADATPMAVVESLEPESVIGPPARAPWSTTVVGVGQRPVRHPTLLSLRQDFVAELWRLAVEI
ncbi:MAG: hypothetical protein KDK70_40175 [Myxococcales bacterium]|nr:hypothetical protein [Myxococcales bacterium]